MLGFLFRRSQPSSPELGVLGTHAYRVTDWEPGPTTWRPVNMGDLPTEPLRRSRTVKGPLVFGAERNIALFQGEKTPSAQSAPAVSDAASYIEAWSQANAQTGYPS